MGNCFTGPSPDDVSLLTGAGGGEGGHLDSPDLHTPPPLPLLSSSSSSSTGRHSSRQMPVYHPAPGISRPANQLTEREQIRIAKRIGLIQHLPTGTYDGSLKLRECVICMGEFVSGDVVRYLPCVHTYHKQCIDEWLMRSFTCPSCMEPVDAALFMTYYTN